MQISIAAVISILASAWAFADTSETVVKVETDAFPGTSALDVVRNDAGVMKALVYRPSDEAPKQYTLDQLQANAQLLKQVDGHDVIFLSLEKDFDPVKGGHANMRYLHSGFSGEYRNFRIALDVQKHIVLRSDPNPQDPDSDGNSYTSTFNYLFMEKNTFWGRVIGVERVVPEMKSALEPTLREALFLEPLF
jgi:hypothetical protein